MSTFDNPFDPDRRLRAGGCSCGQHVSEAEHEHAALALRCEPQPTEDKRYEGVVASAVMRAMFPKDVARRAFLKSVGASTALYAISMAGVTAIQSSADRDLIHRGSPAEDAAARLGQGNDRLETTLTHAADVYTELGEIETAAAQIEESLTLLLDKRRNERDDLGAVLLQFFNLSQHDGCQLAAFVERVVGVALDPVVDQCIAGAEPHRA